MAGGYGPSAVNGGTPWAPEKRFGDVTGSGIKSGSGAIGYVTGPGGKRPVKAGDPVTLGVGEAYVQEAPPGDTTRADQIRQAALYDRNQAMDAQKRAQGRSDKALAGYQAGIDESLANDKDMTSRIDAQMKKGQGDFEEAKKFYRDSVSGFEDRATKDAAATVGGIQEDTRKQIAQIESDPNMPDDVKQSMIAKAKAEGGRNAQTAITGLYSRANDSLASLRQGAGAGLAGIAANSSAANQAYLGLMDASKARGAQLRMQGRDAMANLLTQYPDSAFSMVDTLLKMNMAQGIPDANKSGFKV